MSSYADLSNQPIGSEINMGCQNFNQLKSKLLEVNRLILSSKKVLLVSFNIGITNEAVSLQ